MKFLLILQVYGYYLTGVILFCVVLLLVPLKQVGRSVKARVLRESKFQIFICTCSG